MRRADYAKVPRQLAVPFSTRVHTYANQHPLGDGESGDFGETFAHQAVSSAKSGLGGELSDLTRRSESRRIVSHVARGAEARLIKFQALGNLKITPCNPQQRACYSLRVPVSGKLSTTQTWASFVLRAYVEKHQQLRGDQQMMLRSTFLHVPGIGKKREKVLWESGVHTWTDLLDGESPRPTFVNGQITDHVRQSVAALGRHDIEFFARYLPRAEWWRLYEEFRSCTVFLDIETTGLSRQYHDLTLVGCYDAEGYHAFIAGPDTSRLKRYLRRFSVLVTFNGIQFDSPFLQHKIPDLVLPKIHLDLRYMLARIGLRGGLKSIEEALGLHRQPGGAKDGREAVELWYRFVHGDDEALRSLVTYNYDDTVVLAHLAEFAVRSLKKVAYAGSVRAPQAEGPIEAPPNGRRAGLEDIFGRLSRKRPHTKLLRVNELLTLISGPNGDAKVVGVDITGSESKPSGWACLSGPFATTMRLKTDREILQATLKAQPDLVSIDSPLSLPPGAVLGADGEIESYERIHRDSELELRRRGVSVYWALLPSMRALTLRGIRLTKLMREQGLRVIESFPGAAQDMLAMPRKGKSESQLAKALAMFGITGEFLTARVSHDELDAITSAIVGLFYLSGSYEALGESEEDDLIVPRLPESSTPNDRS